ncbi:protein archease isoform X2 [Cygnus atratus]|uniref:protein archease isoform X2 n=1 Tax=Cygnus atratus TaxID=8868 RepID=UPI0015D63A7D|nr:protein archease isoform X2 [Cygnus atratus]
MKSVLVFCVFFFYFYFSSSYMYYTGSLFLVFPTPGMTSKNFQARGRQPKHHHLDHTADVQLHAWGDTLEEAFEQCVMAMFGYMTDTETVEPLDTVEVEAEGHDMLSLLFHFLDEWLYKFSANEFFVPREVKVLYIDRMQFKIRSIGWGEEFSLQKHPQGTEVKAITYSAMQICEEEKPEVFVIIDI